MATDPLASLGVPATPASAPTPTSSADPLASLGTPAAPPAQSDNTQPGLLTRAGNAIGEFGAGIVPGAVQAMGDTIQSLPYVGKKIISPEAMQAEREYFKPGSAAEKAGQTTGEGLEATLEFVLGDEALKGLSLADKIGLTSKITKIAQDSPYLAKLIEHGAAAGRFGTVGTTEALAKGATLPSALKTGAATGVGGEALSAAAEAAPEAIKTVTGLTNKYRARVASAAASSDPGFIEQVLKGEGIAQAPAQEAARTAVQTGGGEVGLQTAQPESLRTIVEQPIGVVNGIKKNVYAQVDQAAGTDLKTLYDKLDAINDKIDLEASGSPEEARLEAQRTSQMQTIEEAKTAARAKGVDVDTMLRKGDALHTREMALRDLQKSVFKNVNVVSGNVAHGTPEMMDVDSTVKALQRLEDNTKFGAPRLEQALGKDGAKQFLDEMYAAQRSGVKAASRRRLAEWIAGATAATATGADIAKHILFD